MQLVRLRSDEVAAVLAGRVTESIVKVVKWTIMHNSMRGGDNGSRKLIHVNVTNFQY
jgi:hypothetical protein